MILVDQIQIYETPLHYKQWSHMVSDISEEELHAFARLLGLERRWFQSRPPASAAHYDITPGKRSLAIQLGAWSVTSRELVTRNYDGLTRRTKEREIEEKAITGQPLEELALGRVHDLRRGALNHLTAPTIKMLPPVCRKHPRVPYVDGRCPLCA